MNRAPLSGIEWSALAMAIVIANAFYFRGLLYPSDYDAALYVEIAIDIGQRGLFSKYHYSDLRSYGYPLFLLAVKGLADAIRVPWGLAIFEIQLSLYLGAVLFVRSQLARASLSMARLFAITSLLNVVALVYFAETLAEGLSLVLLLVATGCWVHVFAAGNRALLAVAAGGLAVGAAIVVRPANVFVIPVCAVAGFAVAVLRGWSARQRAVATLVAVPVVALALIPQFVNNVQHYGRWTPLLAASLAHNQQIWGIEYMKYATALAPIPEPSVFYRNPFAEGRPVDETRPLAWYVDYPGPGAATLGLHVFGMLDQDLLFTYARDLDPWYRRPLGVATHGAIALAMLGMGLLARRSRHDREQRAAFVVLSTFILCNVALHALTAVEMRFGLPLLVVAAPLAWWFLREAWPRSSNGRRALIAAFVGAWIVGSLLLSDWMRAHAAPIREWQARATASPG